MDHSSLFIYQKHFVVEGWGLGSVHCQRPEVRARTGSRSLDPPHRVHQVVSVTEVNDSETILHHLNWF